MGNYYQFQILHWILIINETSLSEMMNNKIMSKKIEEELTEMNRLKRLELEFLFFKTRMDETISQKFRDALMNKNTVFEDVYAE